MKYRTKLLITFAAVGLVTNGISLGVLYRLSSRHLFEGYQAKLLSITASVATMVDGELLKTIQSSPDQRSAAYTQLRETLRNARDANRRKDTYMKRVFTVMTAPSDHHVLLIGVDPEESLQYAGRPGEVYRGGNAQGIDIEKTVVEDAFVSDEFGSWLRAHAPVRDRNGQVVGAVIVEAQSDWVQSKIRTITISGAWALAAALSITVLAAILLSRRVNRPLAELHTAVKAIGKGDFQAQVPIRSRDEFGQVGEAINQMAAGLSERERVKSAFARYVSHQVLDSVLQSGVDELSGDRRRISVLFCDIRGFTSMSENLAPEKVVLLLNEYFERMVEVVFRNHGTLDKFIGDGLMVIFGAPEDDPYQEENALKAAIEMQAELRKLAEKWKTEGLNLRIGIGINSGPAIVGNIGSTQRMEYTAIGDTVNLASRLESATKDLGVGILVSEYTQNAVRGSFRFRNMGPVHVRGRNDPVMTYSIEEEAEPGEVAPELPALASLGQNLN